MSKYSIEISERQEQDIENCIIITGAPRSGTTLLGKIVSTFENLEYFFEPPTLYMISCLVSAGHIPKPAAADLLKIYLYEDLFLESVHGRKINLRPNDDSLILNSIPWKEVVDRWQNIQNRNDAMKIIDENSVRCAFKMPNIMDSLDFFCEYLKNCQIVLIVRDGREVVRSLIKKGWLQEEALKNEIWPYQRTTEKVRVPYWVESDYYEEWNHWSEATRAAYMWLIHSKIANDWVKDNSISNDRLIIVRYDELLSEPEETVNDLLEFLNCSKTKNSNHQIKEIREPSKINLKELTDFYSQVDKRILDKFVRVNQLWGYDKN